MKRSIAYLLALVLALSCAPMQALAQELTEETTAETAAAETTAATEAAQAAETLAETIAETAPAETVPQTTPTETAPETVPAETEIAVEETIAAEAQDADAATGTPDGTPPVLNNLTISATTVTASGSIDVIADASDDISGVDWVSASFYCDALDEYLSCHLENTYWDDNTFKELPYADGKFHGTIKVDQYQESGTFKLDSITVYDIADNATHYDIAYNIRPSTNPNYVAIPDSLLNLQITVSASDTPDGTPPVLNSLTISATTVTAPGSIDVIADASDDISGVDWVSASFYCDALDEYLSCHLENTYWDDNTFKELPYADGKFHGTIKVDQYQESGTFKLDSITVYDIADNATHYDIAYNIRPSTNPNYVAIPDSLVSLQIAVRNSDADITTSVANSDFVQTVQQANNNAYIVADYSGEATLTEDAFTAIAGTDKTLDLVSEGITWRFEGSDIVNEVKPIDLQVDIHPVEEDTTASGDDIQDNLNKNPGVVMKFAENGELPGKATIQVKVDYAMQQYLGSSQYLNVYYYNNETGELELIAENLAVNGESYVEFPITHCSYYVLTGHVAAGSDAVSMYRLYNPNSGEHFYTGSLAERNTLITAGWNYEGVAWNAPTNTGIPVYRLYNPNSGDHHYTMSIKEQDMLVAIGWQYEGVAWNSAGDIPQYRLYNPNADCGSHHYTSSIEERDYLVSLGWKYEGIGWYGMLN